jgi:hypothetical protein
MTFGGIPARFVTIDGESYIAVKQSDVDAVTMKVMTSMTREISK